MWSTKYFQRLRLYLIIVPALGVTLFSLNALASSAVMDAAAASQPGDSPSLQHRPALHQKETLTQNPEVPARIELTPESNLVSSEKQVVFNPIVLQEPQDDDRVDDKEFKGNRADDWHNGPEGVNESWAPEAASENLANEPGDEASPGEDVESNSAITNHNNGETDHNHNSPNDNSGHADEKDEDHRGSDDDNSGHGQGDNEDNGEDKDNSGHGNRNDETHDEDKDNSGHGNGDDGDE